MIQKLEKTDNIQNIVHDFHENIYPSDLFDFFEFGPIKNINIFIGENNSRKSRLIRQLFANPIYVSKNIISHENIEFLKFLKLIKENLIENVSINNNDSSTIDLALPSEIEPKLTELKYLIGNSGISVSKNSLDTFIQNVINFILPDTDTQKADLYENKIFKLLRVIILRNELNLLSKRVSSRFKLNGIRITSDFEVVDFDNVKSVLDRIDSGSKISSDLMNPNSKMYFPVFRSSHSFFHNDVKITEDILKDTTANNFFKNQEKAKLNIYTGFDFSEKILVARTGRKDSRNKFNDFENFVSKHFFGGKPIDITSTYSNKNEEKSVKIYIDGEDKHDRTINELGDGIQALLLMLYPIFMADENTWFFIEEPELHLHPGYQKLFIKTILENENIFNKNLKFFITSHSNHFLESAIEYKNDISIFRLQKVINANYSRILPIAENYTDVLRSIGVNNLSVVMANCSIWVEGNSDRLIIQKFLEVYLNEVLQKRFIIGLHYTFFEYGGSLLGHYLFDETKNEENEKIKAMFLSNRIFLLADYDKKRQSKHSIYQLVSQNNKEFKYQTTIGVEIENIIPASILLKFSEEVLKAEIKDSNAFISYIKKNNTHKRVGSILKEVLPNVRLKFCAENGTLTNDYKRKLSEFISKQQKLDWNAIKENKFAKEIIEKMGSFIESNNPS
ncbi:MAG: AAA family ATPase [Flavobacteriales bacterium]|nr:AAA family ATPase [Flavobacteriales bacterium]